VRNPAIFGFDNCGKRRYGNLTGLQHDAIIITSRCAKSIDKIHAMALDAGLPVIGPGISRRGEGKAVLRTLLVCPDGYSLATRHSIELDKNRKHLIHWLAEQRLPMVDWAAITFGAVQARMAAVTDSSFVRAA